jgi:ATP-dependent RNA/DNA helicase IGHMBP2
MKRLIDALGDECTKMLTIQYRMNKLINNWISEQLYESKLVPDSSVAHHLLCDMQDIEKNQNTSQALVLIDTEGCEMTELIMSSDNSDSLGEESKANDGEANLVCKHVEKLIQSGLKQEQIAIITPYNLQMELIRAKLSIKYPLVECKSVDGFQGREKEAVILSLVRSNSRGEVGFLSDRRRINVAITRARRHLCVVCDSQTCKNDPFLKSFFDYCDKYADVRSAFDYIHDNHNNQEFEDVKFEKLKIKPESKHKEPIKQQKPAAHNDLTSTEEKEKEFREKTLKIIQNLSDKGEHTFSSGLNSFQRRIVHELAELNNLFHESRGENEKRFILISKRPFNTSAIKKTEIKEPKMKENQEKLKIKEEEKEVKTEKEVVKIQNKFDILPLETVATAKSSTKSKGKPKKDQNAKAVYLLGELDDQESSDLKFRSDIKQCPYCTKQILLSNYSMHELHCAKIYKPLLDNNEQQKKPKSDNKEKAAASSSAKKDLKVKKDPLSDMKSDDFDDLLNAFQKSNNVCNFIGCKTLVKTLGQTCEFCSNRFCLTHSLAEAHGCGDEAKKQARAHIRKTGNLDVNERQFSYSQQMKKQYLEKKVHEKIQDMQAARSGQNKKKDKK